MVTVTYYASDGVRYDRAAPTGDSIMDTAVTTGVPGIEAICGARVCAAPAMFMWTRHG